MTDYNVSAVDLFCGIGGLSYGFKEAGINIKAGIDFDNTCKYAFEANCGSRFIHADVSKVKSSEVLDMFDNDDIKVLVGCAPCQPFSTYTLKGDKQKDSRWRLLYEFSRIIKDVKPDIVSMENVPNLLKFKKEPVFHNFVKELEEYGYHVWYDIVFSPDYGIPQKRKRLVLLASKKGKIELIKPTHTPEEYISVRKAIGNLEKISSGEASKKDFIHKASKISEKNLKRIRQSIPGGSWSRDWDEDLKLDCHKTTKGQTYVSVYGRMEWDKPSPTMTTFCTGIGNGRFGHPEQDRAISLREAAILQSFPQSYKFTDKKENLKFGQVSRQIGNAVPPKLGEVIGISIMKHLKEMKKNV
ncbi:DNA cytosine methyltransferase [Sulfurimonas sp.]|uniref:DNA cytosine methyltransferase n=1 Tax=Sulfurimonas sp. TaxID=2022749 RepID=UPI0025E10253|nr:DNA cytosine methyltransferase [Sulfurimonas sp.]